MSCTTVCCFHDLTSVAAIELDDKIHTQKHRQKRGELLKTFAKKNPTPASPHSICL